MQWTRFALLMLLGLALTACGSDSHGVTPGIDTVGGEDTVGGILVETLLEPDMVAAGEAATVSCVVTAGGVLFEMATQVVVTGTGDPFNVDPGPLVLETMGEYGLTCVTIEGSVEDESPAALTVTLGPVVKVLTEVAPDMVVAGEDAEGYCTLLDAFGNQEAVESPQITAEPEAGITIDGGEIHTLVPGEFVLECAAEKGVEVVPATLTVDAGEPAEFLASLDPDTIEAGGSAEVSCAVLDATGNALEVPWVVQAPEDITVNGTTVTTTLAGSFKIECAPADGAGDPTLKAATLTVNPGPAVEMLVGTKPAKDAYCLGDSVTVTHDMVDQYGNPVSEVEIHPVTADPATAAELTNGIDKFALVEEGWVSFHVQSIEGGLTGDVEILCDCSGPEIQVTYPNRGQTLTGNPAIVVTGKVTDVVTDVTTFLINDEPVELTPDGFFQYPVTLAHSVNFFKFEAADEGGNTTTAFRSCVYSTEYYLTDFTDVSAGMVEDGLMLFLAEDFFDDGDHSLPANDLATILEVVMAGFDLAGLIPGGDEGFELMAGCNAYLNEVTVGQPQITLQTVDGGLHMIAMMPDLWTSIDISCCFEVPYEPDFCNNYYAFPTADAIAIDAFIFIDIAEDGTATASLGPMELDLENLQINGFGMTGPLLDTFINFIIGQFKDMIIDMVYEEFGTMIPELLEETLATLSEGFIFELPGLVGEGPGVELRIGLGIDKLQFSYDGMELDAGLSMATETGISHPNLGAIAYANCGMPGGSDFDLPMTDDLELGAAIDVINEALWAIWQSGFLQFDLAQEDLAALDLSAYGVSNLAIQTDFYYAPVLTICGLTETMLRFQVGDHYLHLELDIMGMHWDVGMFLFLEGDMNLNIVVNEETGETEIGIELVSFDYVEMEIVSTNDVLEGKEYLVEGMFKDTLIPELTGSLGEDLSFALPEIDLATLAEGMIPEGTTIAVDIQQLDLIDGYLFIAGGLK